MRSVLTAVLVTLTSATGAAAQAATGKVHFAGAVTNASVVLDLRDTWTQLLASAGAKAGAALAFVVVLHIDENDRCTLLVRDLRADSKDMRWAPNLQPGDVVFVPPEAAKGKPWTRLNVLDAALAALGTMGAVANAALPDLRRLADSENLELRKRVAVAIGQIEGKETGK